MVDIAKIDDDRTHHLARQPVEIKRAQQLHSVTTTKAAAPANQNRPPLTK